LLALPYLDCIDGSDSVYENTRRFVLSSDNPYFFSGKAAEGIGSPHTLNDKIWPMTIIMRAMTSANEQEIKYCLHMLKNTHAGTGFMHESFNKDNPSDYTRSWFAWANTLFGELICKVHDEYPGILAYDI
jgi:meiotically up-regulated gene 157 (Mug157) protein